MKKDLKEGEQQKRSNIISNLYENKRIGSLIRKAASGKGEQFEDELRSIVFLSICEMDTEKLFRLHDNNELQAYMAAKIRGKATDSYYGISLSESIPNRVDNAIGNDGYLIDYIKSAEREGTSMDIERAMKKLNWFENHVIEKYIELGSIVDVVKNTGCDQAYVVKMLNSARNKIRNALR
jgi:hypothetical protein